MEGLSLGLGLMEMEGGWVFGKEVAVLVLMVEGDARWRFDGWFVWIWGRKLIFFFGSLLFFFSLDPDWWC